MIGIHPDNQAPALEDYNVYTSDPTLRRAVARGGAEWCDAELVRDRPGLERLLRYCARPPFAMDRLRKEGSKLVYRQARCQG